MNLKKDSGGENSVRGPMPSESEVAALRARLAKDRLKPVVQKPYEPVKRVSSYSSTRPARLWSKAEKPAVETVRVSVADTSTAVITTSTTVLKGKRHRFKIFAEKKVQRVVGEERQVEGLPAGEYDVERVPNPNGIGEDWWRVAGEEGILGCSCSGWEAWIGCEDINYRVEVIK